MEVAYLIPTNSNYGVKTKALTGSDETHQTTSVACGHDAWTNINDSHMTYHICVGHHGGDTGTEGSALNHQLVCNQPPWVEASPPP